MHSEDEDIKIFRPKKNDGSGAELAEMALLTDAFRLNGNIDKAKALGERLADITPESICADEARKLNNNELFQLRSLILFASQLFLHKYLPHQALSAQAVNAMYNRLEETSEGVFANISDGSSFSFYYLSVRKNVDIEENIGRNFAMLCDKDDNPKFIALGKRIFSQMEETVCELIEDSKFID